jgi:hypothetical protein
MDLECVGSMERTYLRLASVIIDGVQSGKEQTMLIRVNYMKSMYPMEIEADSVEEALNTYWYEVEWDESYDIIEDDEEGVDDDSNNE